jgi:hypothetical protein
MRRDSWVRKETGYGMDDRSSIIGWDFSPRYHVQTGSGEWGTHSPIQCVSWLFHHHQLRYNPDRVLASARSLLHLLLSWAPFFQLLIPSFLTSWATPSAHLSLGLPASRVPYSCDSSTCLAGSESSNLATFPAHRIRPTLICETKSWSPYNLYNSLLYLLFQRSPSFMAPKIPRRGSFAGGKVARAWF